MSQRWGVHRGFKFADVAEHEVEHVAVRLAAIVAEHEASLIVVTDFVGDRLIIFVALENRERRIVPAQRPLRAGVPRQRSAMPILSSRFALAAIDVDERSRSEVCLPTKLPHETVEHVAPMLVPVFNPLLSL